MNEICVTQRLTVFKCLINKKKKRIGYYWNFQKKKYKPNFGRSI